MHELKDLQGILGLMEWDRETYAPPQGQRLRGEQSATLEAIRHQRLTDPALGDLIAAAKAAELSEVQSVCIARVERERDRAIRVPESLVKHLAEARSASLQAWQQARAENDFASFAPHLATIFDLLRQKADALGGVERYDALLDEYEPEMTRAQLEPVLRELRDGLVPLVQMIADSGHQPRRDFLRRIYDPEVQWAFTLRLLDDLGFDSERGRQDRSTHPFTGGCGLFDVRVTTRIFDDNPLAAIYSTIHECGHALYEQGFDEPLYRTAVAAAPSMGIHESQSRLWENQIGRSGPFLAHYLPALRDAFPDALAGVTHAALYAAVNDVRPSLIRVEADEVTYNLHILVRFELELALLSGDLQAQDLPGAWNERMNEYLGIMPKTDAEGCLQDIHWALGAVGYFPTYSLGNLWAAQLMRAYEAHNPSVWEDVEAGRFAPLLSWLRDAIYRHGFRWSASETIERVTGTPLEVGPFLQYLQAKFGGLYAT